MELFEQQESQKPARKRDRFALLALLGFLVPALVGVVAVILGN